MSKNYFTDSQVEDIAVNAGFPVAAKHMKEELRTLMNLAVETAIGEPYLNVDHGMTQNVRWIKVNDLKNKSFLYSVKELEN